MEAMKRSTQRFHDIHKMNQAKCTGFGMTEMLVAISAGVMVVGAGGIALRTTGGLINASTQRAVLRQNTNNGMRLLRSEVERSLHLIVNTDAENTPERDDFDLGSKKYKDLLTHCRTQAQQQGMQIFLPLVGIKMAPTELVEPVLYGYSLSNKSNGYIMSRCGAPLDKTGAYIKTSNDGVRNEFLSTVIDNIGQMDCAKTTDAQGTLLYLDNSCDGGNDDLPEDTTVAQILQNMQTNAGNGEGLLLSTNSNGEIVSPEVLYRQPTLRIQTDSTLKLLKFIDPNKRDKGRTYSYLEIENNGRTTTTQPLYLAAYARADKRLGQYGSDEGLQNITIFKNIDSNHIRFVLDGSGSMSACIIWDDETSSNGERKFWGGNGYVWTNQVCALTRMETLIDELYTLISTLDANKQIGLEMFSSSKGVNHDNQWTHSKDNLARLGNSGVRVSAQEWILSLDDEENVGKWGGTIPWPALRRAFDDKGADTVYFLSDGEPDSFSGDGLPGDVNNQNEVVSYFTDLNESRDQSEEPKLSVNTIALGLQSNWMQQLSEENNGNYMQYDSESKSEANN